MRRVLLMAAIALAAGACLPASAGAAFGIYSFGLTLTDSEGKAAKAGSHPFAVTTTLGANFDPEKVLPEGWLRDFVASVPPGLVGDTTAYESCTTARFLQLLAEGLGGTPSCPLESQVGVIGVSLKSTEASWAPLPLFNVAPPPGVLVRLGFRAVTQNVFIDVTLNPNPPYNAIAAARNTPQVLPIFASVIELWGNPSDPAHDELRRGCGPSGNNPPPGDIEAFEFQGGGKACPVPANPKPFLTAPTQCSEPLLASFVALSWEGDTDEGSALAPALEECDKLNFKPSISARPTSGAVASPTGLDFELTMQDEGLTSTTGLAASQMRKAVVTLPEGMTINPSQAEGLEVCSEEDLQAETLAAEPGEGCPQASKIGTVVVETPLVSEAISGALFVAEPHRNLAGDSLIAVYLVVKNRNLGIIVKQPLRVEPDPQTGQLVTIAEGVPQLPFSSFRLHFREGGRSPLITPPLCGAYEVEALLYPHSGGPPVERSSAFEIVSGQGGGPCPPGGTPPFSPGFEAGSQSNAAGRYSPFSMRLTRRDGDQDLVRFDATLPPGVLAKLAGVSKCPDAQIALAKAKSGKAELASPSCPLGSRIGGVLAGAGVGSQLTYVGGTVYLAGPFAGAPLSAVAIVPAVAGPFDVGTVVYRQALRVHPRTGEVSADGGSSDPLPHILAGIPLVVRDIQVHIDRSGFTLNPTSCDPEATLASIWGGGLDPFSLLDDRPLARAARYQAASCQSLGFKPRLNLRLKGGTRRGAHPAVRGVFGPRPGDANTENVVLRLPRSAFLDQGHIRTICTRVQFAAESCPPAAAYGHVVAHTPLLSEPLQGPAYLRSSDNDLPDLVFDLHGLVDFEAVARVDSIKGGIRLTFTDIPDAPIAKVIVEMQGGRKGLIVNSTNLCAKPNRAKARLDAHSGKQRKIRPLVRARCGGKKRG